MLRTAQQGSTNSAAAAAKDVAWQAALKTVLKPAEIEAWQAGRQDQSNESRTLLTQLAVAGLDHKLLLLPEQRSKVEALARKATEGYEIDATALMEFINNYSIESVQGLLGGMDIAALKAVLDERQSEALAELQKRYASYWSNLGRCMKKKP